MTTIKQNLMDLFEIEKMLQWGTPEDLEVYNSWSNYFSNIIKPQPKFEDKLNTTLILPMAGKGDRFVKMGYTLPKPLLDVNNSPMVVQAVKCLPETKNKVFICLEEHVEKYKIDETLKNEFENVKVLKIDKTTDGQACTSEIGISGGDLEKPILISACDNGVYFDHEEYNKLVEDENIDIIVWSFTNAQTTKNNPNMYSWLDVDNDNNIKEVSCKNFKYRNISTAHAIIGTMFFRKAKYFMDGLQENYKEDKRTN